jgi:hypothetical protein
LAEYVSVNIDRVALAELGMNVARHVTCWKVNDKLLPYNTAFTSARNEAIVDAETIHSVGHKEA